MNIIFGKNGQVAKCLADELVYQNQIQNWRFIGSNECNFENPINVKNFLNSLSSIPSIIINASAYTNVDLAETEQSQAMNINGHSVKEIAQYCHKHSILLIHYSTDYIFNGETTKSYSLKDTPKPINYYGFSKLQGEQSIIESNCKYYILRVSWVYSQYSKNFVKTMLKLMQERNTLSIVSDQIGSPTSAIDIAKCTLKMFDRTLPYGVYHFTGDGLCSWYDFAIEISQQASKLDFNLIVKEIKPIATESYQTPAKRPLNSRLAVRDLQNFTTKWQLSLHTVLKLLHSQY